MFNRFLKFNMGRTNIKVISLMLAFILVFTNFSILGSFIYESLAVDKEDAKTNIENVKFEAYFNSNEKEVTADFNSKELNLKVLVEVQNEGKVENAKIDFEDSNFETDEGNTTYYIGTIESGTIREVEIPIVALKSDNYKLGLLNMSSTIKLTGEYIDTYGNSKEIDAAREVKVTWTANELTEEQVNLSQEIKTNKVYTINEEEKRVIQLEIATNINDNLAPINQEKMELSVPQMGVEPEEIKVVAKSTQTDNRIDYKVEDGKIIIDIQNNPNEDGYISWKKDSKDELIVTYIYDKDVELTPFVSDVKMQLDIYGKDETINKENALEVVFENNDFGSVIEAKEDTPASIYKGYMYAGENTNYETKQNIFISYANAIGELEITDTAGTIGNGSVKNYFTGLKINKQDALDLLGQEGTISIFDEGNLQKPIKEVNLNDEIVEDYIEVELNGLSRIVIKTSNPINEGNLEIISNKEIIVVDEYNGEDSLMSTLFTLKHDNEETYKIEISKEIELKEPETKAEVELDKDAISSQLENSLRITTLLKAFDASEKLYSNPTLTIELPKEIKEVQIENIKLIDDELQIESSDITEGIEGNKVIVIKTLGTQTKHNKNSALRGANIVIDLKVSTDKFMADRSTNAIVTINNEDETLSNTFDMTIVSRKGFVTKNAITIGDNKEEQINNDDIIAYSDPESKEAAISTSIINNHDGSLKNVTLIGKTKTNLTSAVNVPSGAKVSYLDENNNYVETVEDYTKVSEFKIEINGEMNQADQIDLSYNIALPEESSLEDDLSSITINYNFNDQDLAKQISYKVSKKAQIKQEIEVVKAVNTYSAELSITQKTTVKELYQGQIVTYIVSVTNTGSTTINNAKLQYVVPDGATFTKLEYAQGEDVRFNDDSQKKTEEWNIEAINPGETASREVTIRINSNATKIVNVAKLLNSNNEEVVELKSRELEVKEGTLEVVLSRRDNMEVVLDESSSIRYIVLVKNNSQTTMNNIKVKGIIPEHTEYEKNSEYNNEWAYNSNDNCLYYDIAQLKPGETKAVSYEVKIKNYPQEVLEAKIDNTVYAITSDNEIFESNVFTSKLEMERFSIKLESAQEDTIKVGDDIQYVITVKNIGNVEKVVNVLDEIPNQITIKDIKLFVDGELINDAILLGNKINCTEVLEPMQEIRIEVVGVVFDINGQDSISITNSARIAIANNEYLESNKITTTIIKGEDRFQDNPENPEKPDEPRQTPEDPENGYSISGLAWVDKNSDGIRNNDESILKDISVMLLDSKGNIAKDANGKNVETKTTINGTYKFSGLKDGEYVVAFIYDTGKYTITKYQSLDAKEDTNSDAIESTVSIDGQDEKIAVTNVLKVNGKSLANIDIGLIETGKFDLRLDKYITSVVVTNNSETTTYDYREGTNFTKVEIPAKKFAGSTVLIEYNLAVTNEGEVDGYVSDIIDYIPKDLTFSSELNPNWYIGTDNNLHYMKVDLNKIEKGKVQSAKLVLTKILNSNSIGTITNEAEIGESSNLSGIKESDSIVKNKKAGEDDISKADLIISIKTGSPVMYIGIVLGSLAIIGLAIFVINEKILKGGNN